MSSSLPRKIVIKPLKVRPKLPVDFAKVRPQRVESAPPQRAQPLSQPGGSAS